MTVRIDERALAGHERYHAAAVFDRLDGEHAPTQARPRSLAACYCALDAVSAPTCYGAPGHRRNTGGPALVVYGRGGCRSPRPYVVRMPDGHHEVWAQDRGGTHLLDRGPNVQPGGLALAGSTLYWLRDGAPVVGTLQ